MSEKIHRMRVPGAKCPSRTISLPLGRAMNGRTRWRTGPIHLERQASISSSKTSASVRPRLDGDCSHARRRASHRGASPSSTSWSGRSAPPAGFTNHAPRARCRQGPVTVLTACHLSCMWRGGPLRARRLNQASEVRDRVSRSEALTSAVGWTATPLHSRRIERGDGRSQAFTRTANVTTRCPCARRPVGAFDRHPLTRRIDRPVIASGAEFGQHGTGRERRCPSTGRAS
jgi:hypothetical protein